MTLLTPRLRRMAPALLAATAGIISVGLIQFWRADLPDPVATHWGGGHPDGFTSILAIQVALTAFTVVGVAVCLIVLLPAIDPRARRVLSGVALGATFFVFGLVALSVAVQRGLDDAATAAFSGWWLLPALMGGAVAGAIGALAPTGE